jgi:hypothetical protein
MEKTIQKAMTLFRRWNEFMVLPLALLLFIYSPSLLRMIDPTAAAFDLGVLQVILLGIIKVLFASGFAFLMLKFSFPSLYRVLDEYYDELSNSVNTPIEQLNFNKELCLKHGLLLYVCYLLVFALSMLLV